MVAPLAGAWIEIPTGQKILFRGLVAPLAGAWIEIGVDTSKVVEFTKSHPSRVRGLKCQDLPSH